LRRPLPARKMCPFGHQRAGPPSPGTGHDCVATLTRACRRAPAVETGAPRRRTSKARGSPRRPKEPSARASILGLASWASWPGPGAAARLDLVVSTPTMATSCPGRGGSNGQVPFAGNQVRRMCLSGMVHLRVGTRRGVSRDPRVARELCRAAERRRRGRGCADWVAMVLTVGGWVGSATGEQSLGGRLPAAGCGRTIVLSPWQCCCFSRSIER